MATRTTAAKAHVRTLFAAPDPGQPAPAGLPAPRVDKTAFTASQGAPADAARASKTAFTSGKPARPRCPLV